MRVTRWESFLASFMAVFSKSDEAFSAWLTKRKLMIGDDMRVHRADPDRIGLTQQRSDP